MAQGLQCFDANGNLTLDVTDRLTRVLGQFNTNSLDGSITDSNLASGSPWIFESSSSISPALDVSPLTVKIEGTTITWAYVDTSGVPKLNKRFIYGVY